MVGLSYSGHLTFRGKKPPSLKKIKYTRMRHFECKKNQIFFFSGAPQNVFSGRAVALDVPALPYGSLKFAYFFKTHYYFTARCTLID